MSRTSRLLLPLTVAAALALTVSACSSGDPEAPPTATETVTATATPTPTPSSPPTSFPTATPGPDGASGGGGDLGDGAAGAADDRCRASELSGSIDDGGGGAAGTVGVAIVLTNTGDRTCELQGWPGVSFVGDGNGTQVGAAATLDRSSAHDTVSFAPGGEAQAVVQMTQAANYDPAECEPRAVDGFRVYPPGSVEALFVPAGGDLFTACANPDVQQLSVGAVQTF